MGTGGSFLRPQDDDDILGSDLDGSSKGVIKRIPIEMKPRGKLNGLRNNIPRKPKGGSLRSALSVDLENPEVERIRKDFEMYRLNKENEIANMQRKEQKYDTENKRLRAELTVLQKTCNNMRQERDAAYEEKLQALHRAAAFEHDRDKVQRIFKIFRETKESEIQNLLRAKRELENKMTKIAHGYLPEDNDTTSRTGIDSSLGNSNPGDWWANQEVDSSMGSTLQLHTPVARGIECFDVGMMEFPGPFTNVNKEDWSTALANLNQIVPIIPEHSLSSTLRIYISAPKDAQGEVDIFMKDYRLKLSALCEGEGRGLIVVHLYYDELESQTNHDHDNQLKCRKSQAEKASIFLAFLGDYTNRYTSIEFKAGHLDHRGNKTAIFCFREIKGNKSNSEAQELRNKVCDSGGAKIIDGYTTPARCAELAYTEIDKFISIELGLDSKKQTDDFNVKEGDVTDFVADGVWDINCNYQQMEAFNYAVKSSCELGFEKHYERLNAHVLSAGPLPPLLILSTSGCGRSLLLCKWIQLQVEKAPGSLVLYHFVGSDNSISADPIVMIRRITAQLMQQMTSPPALTCDPVRLVEEFPRWLEKISSHTPGGVILVLDSIDRFHQGETHLKWLLDPLPVDARVIVSAHEDTCPQSWRSWPTLQVEPLSNKNVKELLRAELVTFGACLNNEEETKVLTHCRTAATCIPLYVMVLSRHIAEYSCSKSESKVSKHLDALLTSTDSIGLCIKVLELVKSEIEKHEYRGLTRMILRYLYVSRSGLSERELMDLIPNLTWNFLGPFCHVMLERLVLKYQGGLLMFAHEQVGKAVHDFSFGKDGNKVMSDIRQELVAYFTAQISEGSASCRLTEELPWQLHQTGDKDNLKSCILNMFVFQKMYARGCCRELLSYWNYIGVDKSSMAQLYISATKQMEECVSQYNGLVTLSHIADLYETLGRFLKDYGQLNQALSALQRALEVRETALDPDHPSVAHSLHQLAGLHAHWSKFSTAEALYRQALEIYENAFGSEHFLVAKEYDALALLYQKQEKHDQAEPLKRKAMAIRRGVRTPRSVTPRVQGMEPLRKRALQLEGLCMGPESANQAATLNELGVLHYLQNDFENAESFFKRSLEMRESVLGPNHLDISQSLNNLAALYNDRKLYSKAEPLYERALKIRILHISPDHPSVASVIKHLALLYRKQGKYDKAEPLYIQAVEIREKSFGPNHPSVATALVNLAVLYSQQNKYGEAEPLYERALRIYQESFGAHHPRVAETLRNLAVMKYELKDYETAAKLYKRATEIKEIDAAYTGKDLSRRSSSAGNSNPGDWWANQEVDSSMGSTLQLHTPVARGIECFDVGMMEFSGPFTNVNKEDWSTALANLNQIVPIIPEHSLSSTLHIYISAPKDAQGEVDIFMKDYRPKLSALCEGEGRGLIVVHLYYDELESQTNHDHDNQLKCRKSQAEKASIFLAFLGDYTNRYTSIEFKAGHLDHRGNKTAIFCFREIKGNKSNSEAQELRNKVCDSGGPKIIDGYTTPARCAELAYTEIDKFISIELGLDSKKQTDDFNVKEGDVTDFVVDGVWDINCNYQQMEAFNYAVKSSCELGFEKHYERLNAHVLSAGPLPPLLILSTPGCGRSLLLCKWIQLQVEKAPGSLVLYHFVGSDNSISADPIVMIRRITAQLMQQMTSPPALTCDPVRLVEEFPRWLEKISSHTPGGVILVLDSIDRFHQGETHLKWLLDPLPVDARVIVSAHEDTCPQSWRSWPTLQVEPLSNKNVKELLRAELVTFGACLNNEEETKLLTHCRTAATCIPLYVMVLSRHIAEYSCFKSESKVSKHLDALLTSTDSIGLYIKVLELVKSEIEKHEYRGLTRMILRYLYVSRSGLSERELMDLIPNLTWNFLGPFCHVMLERLVLKYQGGLLMFAHEQVGKAVHDFSFGKDGNKVMSDIRQELVAYFTAQISEGSASCRLTEELPWQLHQTGDKDNLKSCILNMFVFQKMYARGCCRELLSYWNYIGVDKSSMAQLYISATKQMEECVSQYNGLVTLSHIADLYETLGRFLKDYGQLNQALSALQRALEVRETALDPDHPSVAHSLHQLAGLHAHWSKFSTAEALYRQALEIYENAFGSEHFLVAKEYDALALLYQKQEKHDQAEPLKRKAMAIRRGVRTPRSVTPRVQGMEPLRKRALQLEGLCMGPESANQAATLNELGVLHYLQNDFENAESFFKRSLEMRESVLGPNHLDISQSLNNLAALYNDRKLYSKAEPLYERALKIRILHISPDHPSVASVIKHLALLYRKQGKYDKAEPLYIQAVEIREKSFGPNHPSVATALVNLAVLYSQQNKYGEAEPLYERALRIYQESFGAHHPRVAETLRNLAVMKYELKDYETAAKLYKRATEIKEIDAAYAGKDLSRRSSSAGTNSTVKNLLHT